MYKQSSWRYANVIEIKKAHSYMCNRKGEKRDRSGMMCTLSPEKLEEKKKRLQKHNEIESIKELNRILIANFTEDDQHVVLTYADENLPTIEQSRNILNNFLNRTRRFYKRKGSEFKYVIVTEWNSKRIHHHMVCNSVPGVNMAKELMRLWGQGGTHLTPLYEDKNYNGLAEYLVKETKKTFRDTDNPYRQRYSCSRNLVRPEAKVEIVHANTWSGSIKVPKKLQEEGYYLDRDSVRSWTDWEGYLNCEYKFIKPTDEQLKREKRQQKISDGYISKYTHRVKLNEYRMEKEEEMWN
jgi:hypothetical protein